jgi:hypothetical protein
MVLMKMMEREHENKLLEQIINKQTIFVYFSWQSDCDNNFYIRFASGQGVKQFTR